MELLSKNPNFYLIVDIVYNNSKENNSTENRNPSIEINDGINSTIIVTPILNSGEKIADIIVDGDKKSLYAPDISIFNVALNGITNAPLTDGTAIIQGTDKRLATSKAMVDYVKSQIPTDYITSETVNSYIQSQIPKDYITSNQMNTYVQSQIPKDYITSKAMADYVKTQIPTDYITSEVMTDYVQSQTKKDGPKDYMLPVLDAAITRVRECMDEPCLVFPLVTDMHKDCKNIPQNFDKLIENLKYISNKIKMDMILNLGDSTDGDFDNQSIAISKNDEIIARFQEIGLPYFNAIGNHDSNRYKKDANGEQDKFSLSLTEMYRSFSSYTKDVIYNKDANYTEYYKDFNNLGIRFIVLNSCYNMESSAGEHYRYCYSDSTAEWLETKALNTNNLVIIANHISPYKEQNWDGSAEEKGQAVGQAVHNAEKVRPKLQNFDGTIIMLCGHSHADYSFNDPILSITTCCQKCDKSSTKHISYSHITSPDLNSYDREEGTYTEECFDIVVVRPISGKINFIRCGAGYDREFSFTPHDII